MKYNVAKWCTILVVAVSFWSCKNVDVTLTLPSEDVQMHVGDVKSVGTGNVDLKITINPEGTNFTLESNAPKVVAIENQSIKALEEGTAEILVKAGNASAKFTVKVLPKGVSGTENNHPYVDLGLPSATLWAHMNVGASKAHEPGKYFAWGETSTKNAYDWSSYKYCENGNKRKITKYCTNGEYGAVDGLVTLQPEDDAATAMMGGRWRTPTQKEAQELIQNCKWTWGEVEGVLGYTIEGPNKNTIFMPISGCRMYDEPIPVGSKSDGFYWTASLEQNENKSIYAMGINFNKSFYEKITGSSRYSGRVVRAVFTQK